MRTGEIAAVLLLISICVLVQCLATTKIPIPKQCNTIAQFCVFCYDTEELQTIHDLIPSLDGYTFYISPIEISCYGFRDGSFITTPLSIANFVDTPMHQYAMKFSITKAGVTIKSLIADRNVQFISGDDPAPVFTVFADNVVIEGIDLVASAESLFYRSPLVASLSTNFILRQSNAPVLLQQLVLVTTTLEVLLSSGTVAINNGPDNAICYLSVSGSINVISSMTSPLKLIIVNTTSFNLMTYPGLQLELRNKSVSISDDRTDKCTGTLSSPIIIVIIIVSTGFMIFILDRFFSVSSTKIKKV